MRMHQTTIRFAADTWTEIEGAARGLGVSGAQYVRDSVVARLAYTAGQRDVLEGRLDGAGRSVRATHAESLEALEGSEAVWAQAQLARRRARSAREAARAVQAMRRAR
jgi:hypothetical protein